MNGPPIQVKEQFARETFSSSFKRTEIGNLPSDWDVVRLQEFAVFRTGPFGSALHKSDYTVNGVSVINPMHIVDGKLIPTESMSVGEYVAQRLRDFRLCEGDVIIGRRGDMGRCAVVESAQSGWLCGTGSMIVRCKQGLVPRFAQLVLSSPRSVSAITDTSVGSTMTNLNQAALGQLEIQLPQEVEQRAIAAALLEADALIAALGNLIAKKRAIKLAAMQQLFIGVRRLAPFPETRLREIVGVGTIPADWNVSELRQISVMHGRIGWQGLTESEFTSNPDDPFLITGMNFKDGEIRWDEVYHVPFARYDIAPQIQLRPGDVLMTKDGTIGKLLFVRSIPYPGLATLNSHLLVFRPKNHSFDPLFLYYQLSSRRFVEHIDLHKSGSTFFGLTQGATGKYMMVLPPLDEQGAIAGVLSDMDAEIAALESRRDKTKFIKQGMTQVLLTGRVRLVTQEAIA